MKKKLKKILQKENEDNYYNLHHGIQAKGIVSTKERLLARIEIEMFGSAKIQKAEFKKLCKLHPELKPGLSCYK